MKEEIIVIDFGSQYSHLITRRIREMGVEARLYPPHTSLNILRGAKGIILSGGPQSVGKKGSVSISTEVFNLGVPVLGVCYGLQLISHLLGGKVIESKNKEYGKTDIRVYKKNTLLSGTPVKQTTWMSHGDSVVKLPKGFVSYAASQNCQNVTIGNVKKKIYGVQFHPEVAHTTHGNRILKNFIAMTKVKKTWSMKDFIVKSQQEVSKLVGNNKVVCALSGGVDSSVAASLVHNAIGKNLVCIFVDTGLMRKNEAREVIQTFKTYQNMNLRVVKAEKVFFRALRGVQDPERKRKIIGKLFIELFEKEAKKIGKATWLVQGTLYTDIITSGVSVGKKASVIKSHHNVGGLPKKFGFTLIEPLKELYKDEVRQVGRFLQLPTTITERQPFPGPGLAVRIIGEVTREKVEIVRTADAIVTEEIEKSGLEKEIQQYLAVLPTIQSVGVQGDNRTYGFPIIVRAVTTKDFMTADWARIPDDVLVAISSRITNEIKEVNRVVYDITSKPPGTVEWE